MRFLVHNLRMHFCLFSLLFKGNVNFQNFVKKSKFPKIQNVLLLFCYCHDADHMYNENSLKIFIDNHFFPKNAKFYTFCPKNFALSSTLLKLLQSQKFDIGINQK